MSRKVIAIGSHDKVAQVATPPPIDDDCEVTSVIRNPDQVPDIETLGATLAVYDITSLSTEQFAGLLSRHDAMI